MSFEATLKFYHSLMETLALFLQVRTHNPLEVIEMIIMNMNSQGYPAANLSFVFHHSSSAVKGIFPKLSETKVKVGVFVG